MYLAFRGVTLLVLAPGMALLAALLTGDRSHPRPCVNRSSNDWVGSGSNPSLPATRRTQCRSAPRRAAFAW
jgi:hypothetical protein